MIVYEGGGEGGYGARVSLKLQHKTKVEDVPYALCGFHGQLLASCGHSLRLYSLGKQTLLKKCQNNNFPFFIATLHTMNRRIYVGDLQDSVVYVFSGLCFAGLLIAQFNVSVRLLLS